MEYMNFLQSIWTVVVFVIFIAIVLWAWSARRKSDFNEIANIALDLPVNKSKKN